MMRINVWRTDTCWFDVAALLVGLGVAACGTNDADRRTDTVGATPGAVSTHPDPEGAARARIGVVFDPSRARPGDTIAGVVVERVELSRTMIDSSYVGDIAFRGELELSGRTMPHFDTDAADAACFEADSASAARMPRWAGDRRRSWFCFSNAAAAVRALGASRDGRPARVVIDDFTIHRGLSDQVNSARFVRLVGDAATDISGDPVLTLLARFPHTFLLSARKPAT